MALIIQQDGQAENDDSCRVWKIVCQLVHRTYFVRFAHIEYSIKFSLESV